MRKFMLSTILISTLSFSNFVMLPQQATSAQQRNQTPLSWANISQIFLKKKPPINPRKGGSRPTNLICMVSPDASDKTRRVWSDKPLFIWQGNVKTIVVKSVNGNEILWSEKVNDTSHLAYAGESLQPGQLYSWEVNSTTFVKFQVIEAEQRDRITKDLQNLEKQLQAEGKDAEAIALAKADYFAHNQLWSDVLQQIYSVSTPSAELYQLRQEISQNLCKP